MKSPITKKAVVVHSGGMDSSICLALAIKEFKAENVLSLSFSYHQRHETQELQQAKKICQTWNIDHVVLEINCLKEITTNALTHHQIPIEHANGEAPNTLVVGRNGLMARLGSIHAHHLGARYIYMGVMGLEGANSGYRDCSRFYMDLMQEIMRIDLDDPKFEIRTPLVHLTKKESLEIAHELGVLEFLLEESISCYEGIARLGCQKCPACQLRNQGLMEFHDVYPEISLPYLPKL
jgi:7-cyano-7-deazaguanine synthase